MKKNITESSGIRLVNYSGLYGEEGNPSSDVLIYSEKIQTRSKSFNWEIKPHIHSNYFQIFFVKENGGIFFNSDGKKRFDKRTILIFSPNQVHGFLWDANVDGRILTLSDFLVEKIFADFPDMLVWLEIQRTIPNCSAQVFKEIYDMIKNIDEELFVQKKGRSIMLNFNIGRLLLYLYRKFESTSDEITLNQKKELLYFIKFQKLIKKYSYHEKTIPFYADELNISPVHLNRICQSICSKPASWIIQDNLIQHVKQLLTHTSYSISEICYEMKINDPAYFTRLFKKHVGVSPTAFRSHSEKEII